MTLDDLERRIQGVPKVLKYPLLSQERVKLRTSNLAGTFIGSIRKKLIKIFGEKGPLAQPGAAQCFKVPPIISGMGKATGFEFGRYIDRSIRAKAHSNFGEK